MTFQIYRLRISFSQCLDCILRFKSLPLIAVLDKICKKTELRRLLEDELHLQLTLMG